MAYQVQVSSRAAKQVKRLPKEVQEQVRAEIRALADNPRPAGVTKISGKENLYRVRVRDYRILYEIQDAILLVLVIEVGHRREIYRGI